jgi:transmembrane sensor
LNAASSLYYPIVFGKDEHRVELTGETYFEITNDLKRPLVVVTPEITTEVLGTSFNINTYQDEPNVKVTLLEDSIRVNKEKS